MCIFSCANFGIKLNMCELKKLKYNIDASLIGNSSIKLDQYLSSLKTTEELLNGDCILVLIDVLKRSEKHEEKSLHVYCVLSCLHHFMKTISDTKKWIEVSEDISKLCDIVFVLSCCFIREDTIIEEVVNVISELIGFAEKIADNLMKFIFRTMLESSLSVKLSKLSRLLIMNLIGTLLQNSSRRIRYEIIPSTIHLLNELSNFLPNCDDYETQVSVVEILARSQIFLDLKSKSEIFIKNEKIGKIFKNYLPFLNFDPDCRLFLNEVNEHIGRLRKVFSLPCIMVFANNNRLRKPIGQSDFWVDFNLGSRSVSFFYQPNNSDHWELMTLTQDDVLSATVKESVCQSSHGERFASVKLELRLDPSNPPCEWEIQKRVMIYFQRDKFIEIEFVLRNIFNRKYKVPEYENKEGFKDADKRKRSSDVEIVESLPYERCIKKRMLEKTTRSHGNGTKENKTILQERIIREDKTLLENLIVSKDEQIRSNTKVGNQVSGNNSNGFFKANSRIINHLDKNLEADKLLYADSGVESDYISSVSSNSIKKNPSISKRENTFVFNNNWKKKCLYCLEKNNADDVMSSQDQALSVKIPSNEITKKEFFKNSQYNINEKNISSSYITNIKQEKSATFTPYNMLKPFTFEGPEESVESLNNDGNLESDGELSRSIFKRQKSIVQNMKPKSSVGDGTKRNIFLNRNGKHLDLGNITGNPKKEFNFLNKSTYSDRSSTDKRKVLKSKKYVRKKLIPYKRNWVLRIESDSQFVSPLGLSKNNKKEKNNLSPNKTRFAESVHKKKIDRSKNNVLLNNMKLDREYEYEEQEMQPKKIVAKILMKQRKCNRKMQASTIQVTNVNAYKKKTKQVSPILTINNKGKKYESEIAKQYILEKLSGNLTGCSALIQYGVAHNALACEDLALDILNFNHEQKTLLLKSTFKASDLLRFGKILMKKIQDKMQHAERLNNKEGEMNLSAFASNMQNSNPYVLYGNVQKIESITDKFEKLDTMLQATYELHKEIITEINLGFVGYLKKIVLSFVQGFFNKSATAS